MCITIAILLISLVLDYMLILPGMVRLTLLISGLVIVGYALFTRLLRPVFTSAPNDELGAAMDLKFPELQESLATLISIDNPAPRHRNWGPL